MSEVKVIVSMPRGSVTTFRTKGGSFTSKLEWNSNFQRFNRQYSKAQSWLDETVLNDSNKYVPMRTGALYKTGILGTTPGEGIVQWIAPYARYMYYGKVMVDAATGKGPIHYIDKFGNEVIRFRKGAKLRPTSKNLNISKSEHPQARPFWFEAAKAQRKAVWVRGVQRIAGGG